MRIVVCVKSVPDSDYYERIDIDPVTKTLMRDGIPTVINPADKHALEQALCIKEKMGGEVTVVSMGPPNAKQQLLEALAIGADKAYLLSDRRVGGADTLATSYTLSRIIAETGPYDMILAGNESADGATSHVPSQLGQWLGLTHSSNVTAMEMEDEAHVLITKTFEDGTGVYRVSLPSVIAVSQRINAVRLVNAMAILKAKNKPLIILNADDMNDLNPDYIGLKGSPSKNGELEVIESEQNCEMLEGSAREVAKLIAEKIQPMLGKVGASA